MTDLRSILDWLRHLVTARAPDPVCFNCGAPVAWGVVCADCRFGTPSSMAKDQVTR